MAQPNIAREPSMDEILASIRRIIESNEPVPASGVATGRAEPEGFSGRPANDDSEEVTLTVDETFAHQDEDSYRPEPISAAHLRAMADYEPQRVVQTQREDYAPHYAEPEPAAPAKTLSLADVAARVRAASERSATLRETPPVQQQMPAAAPEPVEARQPVYSEPHQPVRTSVETVIMRDLQPERPAPEPVAVRYDTEIEEEAAPTTPALMSSMAGEQVARSFQDLAVAFEQAERRSFDEIAAELLRPMLQEWLDDNLPTLVERLVREEIERVARGNRR